MLLIYIAAGGAVGAVARYAVAGLVYDRLGTAFPWGTLAVNLLGSFLLGVLLPLLYLSPAEPELHAFVAVGVLSGFTTFSTFSYETAMLLRERERKRAALYVLASILAGLLSLVAGLVLSARILQP